MKVFVVVSQNYDRETFCHGIFMDVRTAVGTALQNIWEFSSDYEEDGDVFIVNTPYKMEGEGGTCIHVQFKKGTWDFAEKPLDEWYYILECEEPDDKLSIEGAWNDGWEKGFEFARGQ